MSAIALIGLGFPFHFLSDFRDLCYFHKSEHLRTATIAHTRMSRRIDRARWWEGFIGFVRHQPGRALF